MGYRIYYANHSVAIGGSVLDGVQSVGVSTTYNREPLFQLGQDTVYLDQEDLADVEVTISRLMVGVPMYLTAMGGTSASGKTLANLQNTKTSVTLNTFDDTSGAYVDSAIMSQMYVSNISYTIPIDGNATEDITLIGNRKKSSSSGSSGSVPGTTPGTIARRQHVKSAPSGAQNITFSVDLSREPLYSMGKLEPTVRLLTFPVECTAEVEYLATDAEGGNATSSGGCGNFSAGGGSSNISVTLGCSSGSSSGSMPETEISIGSAVITSVNYSGGDAGGGNATVTYSYRSYNDFTVTYTA